MKITHRLFALLCICCFLTPLSELAAHSPDQSYLYLRIYGDAMGGRVELNAADLNRALDLNLEDDFTMEMLEPHLPRIYEYLKGRTLFSSGGKNYPIEFRESTVLALDEGKADFARFHFDMQNVDEVPETLDIDYNVVFDKNDIHRGMLIVEYNWKAGIVNNEALISHIFSPSANKETLNLADASIWKGFVALVKLGVWHIWIGLDHILFLVALILPAVVRRRNSLEAGEVETLASSSSNWLPVAKFKPAFIYILKIVTFFTIA
ncbi:MAG: HupE/UreJ family protein, partial [Bacteroidota bacterium]